MLEVTAAIIKENNKILICQRAKDDECGLLWEFPGGKKEAGESLEECIIREIKEELNLDIIVHDVFAKTMYQFSEKKVLFTFFNVSINGGNMLLNVHETAQWVSLEQLEQFSFMPADIEVVEKLRQ